MEDTERTALIWAATVSKLQEVVRDFAVTEDELHSVAEYLTRTAAAGVMRSLVDVALSMTSVDVHRRTDSTRSNPEGPYYRPNAPVRDDGVLIDRPVGPGAEVLVVSGRVREAGSGAAVPGAELDLWQADECGNYDRINSHLRGRVRTDSHGEYEFTTIVPAAYTEHDDDPIGELFRALGRHNYRAGHIHVKIHVAGVECLTTQLYMDDSPYLASDYVEGAVSPDLVLTRHRTEGRKSTASFDIVVAVNAPVGALR